MNASWWRWPVLVACWAWWPIRARVLRLRRSGRPGTVGAVRIIPGDRHVPPGDTRWR